MTVAPAGRPRRYCRRSHRQRAYEARLLAERMGLGRGDVLVSAETLRSVRDGLRMVGRAVKDVERDLRRGESTYEEAFRHLYAASVRLGELTVEPRAWLDG